MFVLSKKESRLDKVARKIIEVVEKVRSWQAFHEQGYREQVGVWPRWWLPSLASR